MNCPPRANRISVGEHLVQTQRVDLTVIDLNPYISLKSAAGHCVHQSLPPRNDPRQMRFCNMWQ